MVSPPKPWERGKSSIQPSTPSSTPSTSAVPASSSLTPEHNSLPTRPPALTGAPSSAIPNTYNPLPSYSTPYSGYNSAYSRFGSSYSPYGGYGGGMYNGMGMGYGMNGMGYGMNGMYGGMGMPGMQIDPNNHSLTQTLEATTQQTFALLHSIVQTFTGLSQMLESTFMATHSSFFAMVGVVDQFSHLRNALGSVLGLFGLIRWTKELVTGKRASSDMQNEFQDFINGRPAQGSHRSPGSTTPKFSKKPLIIFFLAIFGVPYAMHKLIKALAARAPPPQALHGPITPFDPSTLTFARARYPFMAASSVELTLKENEIVAIMGKLDPTTGLEVDSRTEVETEWWKGRTREGREGWFPSKWVEVLARKSPDVLDGKSVP